MGDEKEKAVCPGNGDDGIPKNIRNDSFRFFVAWFLQRFLLAPVFWFYTRVLNSTEIIGKEHLEEVRGKSFLLCPNHTCSWDIWAGYEIGFAALPSFFSTEYYLCGLGALERLGPMPSRLFALCAGVLPVDRTRGLEQYAMQDLLRLFKSGRKKIGALIYPEGTRSHTGRLSNKFKSGAGWVQALTSVPVVPMYQVGYNELPGLGKKLKIIVGRPLYFDEFRDAKESPGTWIAVSRKIMDAIKKLEDEHNPRVGGQEVRSARAIVNFTAGTWTKDLQDLSRYVVFSESEKGRIGLVECSGSPSSLKWSGNDRILTLLPPQSLENLGSRAFVRHHGLKYAYCAEPLEQTVCSVDFVLSLAKAGMLAFYSIDYLNPESVRRDIDAIKEKAGDATFGVGMRYHAYHKTIEMERVRLLVEKEVSTLYVSHYVRATTALVYFSAKGLRRDETGKIRRRNRLFISVPHASLAIHFTAPAPADLLDGLVERGLLDSGESELASQVPLCENIVVEPDNNGALLTILPAVKHEVRRAQRASGVEGEIFVGAAGQLTTPESLHAAYRMGADFVVTGSVNQLTVEAGGSERRKELLRKVQPQDFAYVPAFEHPDSEFRVSVVKFGTMFASKASRIGKLLASGVDMNGLTLADRKFLEEKCFGCSLDEAFENGRTFFRRWWPELLEKARDSSKAGLLLLLKWYLYETGRWAVEGKPGKEFDYQVRCDPGVGGFNVWRKGSWLEQPGNLTARQLALNLLYGAAVFSRLHTLKEAGIPITRHSFFYMPRRIEQSELV